MLNIFDRRQPRRYFHWDLVEKTRVLYDNRFQFLDRPFVQLVFHVDCGLFVIFRHETLVDERTTAVDADSVAHAIRPSDRRNRRAAIGVWMRSFDFFE